MCMKVVFLVFMFLIGAAMGSFLACQVWRVRYRDLKKKDLGSRSVCLSCKKQLKWYDNVPILSWLFLRGKCRYCGKKIGIMEILAEVLTGLAFLGYGTTCDLSMGWQGWVIFGLMILLILSLGFLALYDGKFGELPCFMLIVAGILAVTIVGLKIVFNGFTMNFLGNTLGAVAVLGGLYFALYFLSKGKLVGDGDWILGAIIGLVLGNAWFALIELFLSNFLGLIVMLPFVKGNPKAKIYFGPFLVIAFLVILTFAEFLNGLIY
ncbi:MAG: prepilin peptidase [Candidatus Saccharibacteria bacterium]|nr:prepilin peptidase [Candidatus Saccharibacteria bacterium]